MAQSSATLQGPCPQYSVNRVADTTSAELLSTQLPSLPSDEPMSPTSLFLEIYVRMPAFQHQETYENTHTGPGYKSPKPETFMADTVVY